MPSNQSGVESRQHANTGPALPQLPEPSYAERVRTLVLQVTVGTLSTLSRKHVGFPFGSLMPYALDPEGRPIFLISNMAMHTQNLKADPRASLFIAQARRRKTLGFLFARGPIVPADGVPTHTSAVKVASGAYDGT
jgi:hypothetical protein